MLTTRNLLAHYHVARNAREVQSLVAIHSALDVAAWEENVVEHDFTRIAVLATCVFQASVIARLKSPLARFLASEDVVHGLRMASGFALVTTVRETVGTSLFTSTFRALLKKFVRLSDLNDHLRVSGAAQVESVADGVRSPKRVDDFLPHGDIGVCLRVANEIHTMLGSTEEHINAVRCFEESNLLLVVAANERDNDDLRFFALEVVDSGHSQ
jgi:hypothetical protein